jgi:hypothetical protein
MQVHILNHKPMTTFIIIASIILSVILWYFGSMYGKNCLAQELEYERLYKDIQNDLADNCSKSIIGDKLKKLKSLKYQNDEKTNVLAVEFLRMFYRASGAEIEITFNKK